MALSWLSNNNHLQLQLYPLNHENYFSQKFLLYKLIKTHAINHIHTTYSDEALDIKEQSMPIKHTLVIIAYHTVSGVGRFHFGEHSPMYSHELVCFCSGIATYLKVWMSSIRELNIMLKWCDKVTDLGLNVFICNRNTSTW